MRNDESISALGTDGPSNAILSRSLDSVADLIKSGRVEKVVVITGAGISTAAGIPDFRSPNTGLYANLARLNLLYAEAVFDINYFRLNPQPFYALASELYPGRYHPTISHAFMALLARKGLLYKLFTQNIDCLERAAGVPPHLIIEAHGSFASQHCIVCATPYPDEEMRCTIKDGRVPHCIIADCGGLVKPDIVFFGERLPEAFERAGHIPVLADLVLIVGTSLTVYPFAALPEIVRQGVPRVLFNTERVGRLGTRSDDVLVLGPCDDGIRSLASLLGWADELDHLWRTLVGDQEAEKQMESGVGVGKEDEPEDDLEEEIKKMIEAALGLDMIDSRELQGPADSPTQELEPESICQEKQATRAYDEMAIGSSQPDAAHTSVAILDPDITRPVVKVPTVDREAAQVCLLPPEPVTAVLSQGVQDLVTERGEQEHKNARSADKT